jgi:cell wall-associated NlpC family hydrolase
VSRYRHTRTAPLSIKAMTAAAAAAAAGVTVGAPSGRAASVADVRAQVNQLDTQAEAATQNYDGDVERVAVLQQQINALQDQAAAIRESTNTLLPALGRLAASQYRNSQLDPALELILTDSPDSYLRKAASMSHIGQTMALELHSLQVQTAALAGLQRTAAAQLADLEQIEAQAKSQKAVILAKRRAAQSLLAELTVGQRRAVTDPWALSAQQVAAIPPASGRAALALSFAASKIGVWYQWGGTGDPGYDCSGLTQAAWAAAGIRLGRTTYEQVTDGYAVPAAVSDLQPGDLIFYSGNTHMAIYVGGGVVIHAPTTGRQVAYAPWDLMPIDAVRRVI